MFPKKVMIPQEKAEVAAEARARLGICILVLAGSGALQVSENAENVAEPTFASTVDLKLSRSARSRRKVKLISPDERKDDPKMDPMWWEQLHHKVFF